MTDFAAAWTAAKNKAFKGSLPPELVLALSQGWDLGPALKTFDKADTHVKRSKAIVAVLKAKDAYAKDIKLGVKQSRTPAEKKNTEQLGVALEAIWRDVEAAAQPVRPSGSMQQFDVLRAFILSAGIKPKYLDVKATEVTVYVEVDAVLVKLMKEGSESLKLQHLGDVAQAELDKLRPAFVQTITAIEAKIDADVSLAGSKAKEANEVLKHYARIVEDRVNQAVAKEWAGYQSRAQHLSDFKLKCGVKIALGTVGVGVAAASLALSFGTAWMSIFAIAKGVTELMQTVSTLRQGIDTTARNLQANLVKVDQLNVQREQARKANAGQKGSKAAEAGKELLNAVLPISKLMIKSCSTVAADAKQLLGQVSKVEASADKSVAAMNQALKLLKGIPAKGLSPAQKKQVSEMDGALKAFFTEITALHEQARRFTKIGNDALAATQKLASSDKWSAGLTADAGGAGTKATAAYAAANFVFQCANAGKALIPM